MKKRRICVSRRRGGLGDQICCEVAVRAAREKYPDSELIWATQEPYFTLLYDQKHYADDVIAPEWSWIEREGNFDLHLELDGPEMIHQVRNDYNLTESRIESWVKFIDFKPVDMCPRWFSTCNERESLISDLQYHGMKPFEYLVVQYGSAESKKDYAHTEELVKLLKQKYNVIVIHNQPVPSMGVVSVIGGDLRKIAIICQLARLVIGPDSGLQHLAAAVKTHSLGLFGPTNPQLYLKHYPLSKYIWDRDVKGKDCENCFPCFGLKKRNWWCSHQPNQHPWCLSKVPPDAVVSHVDGIISGMGDYCSRKALSLVGSSGSSSFYFQHPNIFLPNLNAVRAKPMKQFREVIGVKRCPLQ